MSPALSVLLTRMTVWTHTKEGPSQHINRSGNSGSHIVCHESWGLPAQDWTPEPPGPLCCTAGSGLGRSQGGSWEKQSCPRWTHVWVSLQGSAATRSVPSCTLTPNPRSRTALGTTVVSASMVGVAVAGLPGKSPVLPSSTHITLFLSCLFQQNLMLGILGLARLFHALSSLEPPKAPV